MISSREECDKWEHETRMKNDQIHNMICFGLLFICHYFIISNGCLFYLIPLLLSLFSIGADWYSNWNFYYYYEEHIDDSEGGLVIPPFSDNWILVPFALAILSYLAIFLNNYLLILI